jgi:MoaD family protein
VIDDLRLKVRIRYFASLREITNLREEALEVDEGTDVLNLLNLLVKRHGEEFKEYVFDAGTGNPYMHLQFLLNGKSISTMNGLSTILKDDCEFAIIPPVGGGI